MRIRAAALVSLLAALTLPAFSQAAPNTLTPAEKAAGWHLLFNGTSGVGWHSTRGGAAFPTTGWKIADGMLTVTDTGGGEGGQGGDISTDRHFANYELSVDFRVTPGANSGILYIADPTLNPGHGSPAGYEYQVLDDALHPDAKRGENGDRTVGSLYDMIPAKGTADGTKPIHPVGEWNTARILVMGPHIQHWLNGVLVVDYDQSSPEFAAIVAKSKFHVYPNFTAMHDTPIVLQDHAFPVDFRNIKIRELRQSAAH